MRQIVVSLIIFVLTFFLFIGSGNEIVLKSSLLEEDTFKTIEYQKPERLQREGACSLVSDKTIYLTFDDGPSYLTNQILDILKEKEVPATFFLVGSNLDTYRETVKRAYIEGHTIGLHSNTHRYNEIYASLDAYVNDLKILKQRVKSIIKENPRIVRLPGGSSNVVSRKYKKGIVTEVTNYLNDKHYYYFDWNIDSLDASGRVSKEVIYNSVVNNLKMGANIVLMHDTNTKQTTVEALPLIIDYAKANGYTFARITKNTPVCHHHINN